MKSYLLKINVLIFAVFLFLPVLVFASSWFDAYVGQTIKVNETYNEQSNSLLYYTPDGQEAATGAPTGTGNKFNSGDKINFDLDIGPTASMSTKNVVSGWDSSATIGVGSNNGGYYSELFHRYIPGGSILKTWVNDLVMPWALGIIGTIAVVTVMVAGIMYMTSAGNPKQIELAKTLVKNALSGVAIIVMAKFFLRILGAS